MTGYRIRDRAEAQRDRLSRRLVTGGLEGRVESASPTPTQPLTGRLAGQSIHIPIANAGAGPTAGQDSTPYPMPYPGQILAVELHSPATTSGTSTFRVSVNGTLTGSTITLPSGAAQSVFDPTVGPIAVVAGDIVRLRCVTADAALADFGGYIAVQV